MSRRLLFDMIESEDISAQFLSGLVQAFKKTDKPPSNSPFLNPSSLKCMRQACFKGLGTMPDKQDRSINSIGITSVGSFLHELTQTHLTQMDGWEFIDVADFVKDNPDLTVLGSSGYETKLESKKYRMHFLVDGVMKHDDKSYLIEIKSMTSNKYYALKDLGEYEVQIVSYATLLGLSDVLLIAIDRDLLNYKVIQAHITRNQKAEWIVRTEKILEAINNNKVLPKHDVEKKVCAYCSFRETCDNYE